MKEFDNVKPQKVRMTEHSTNHSMFDNMGADINIFEATAPI